MDKEISKAIAYFAIVANVLVLSGTMVMYSDCMPVNVFVFAVQSLMASCIWGAYKELKSIKTNNNPKTNKQ